MNSIEERLWSYIDGTATADEQAAVAQLIEQDAPVRMQYFELLQLNNEFTDIELDEPPMAFSYNVMEAIRKEEALKPLKAKINTNIIKGISGFFLLVILGFVIVILANIHWSAGNAAPGFSFKMPAIPNYFTGNIMRIFLYIDLVLGLYFFNRYLRREAVA